MNDFMTAELPDTHQQITNSLEKEQEHTGHEREDRIRTIPASEEDEFKHAWSPL